MFAAATVEAASGLLAEGKLTGCKTLSKSPDLRNFVLKLHQALGFVAKGNKIRSCIRFGCRRQSNLMQKLKQVSRLAKPKHAFPILAIQAKTAHNRHTRNTMKTISFFLFLCMCSITLPAQTMTSYRQKADSCAKAGNIRAADSLYTLAIYIFPEAQDYTSRAALRLKTAPCLACTDYFKAATMGDSLAVKKFRKHCYREKTIQNCVTDSLSFSYIKGNITLKQKLANGYYAIHKTDTSFRKLQTQYLLGKDTLTQFLATCAMPDSLRVKMYKYIGDNINYARTSILPFVIGLYSKPEESSLSVQFIVTFSHEGVVLDAQTAGGVRESMFDDAAILRLLHAMPPLGNLGCKPGVYRYSFVIYLSHEW